MMKKLLTLNKTHKDMKDFLHKLIRRGFSDSRRSQWFHVRDAVRAWVLDKGYTRPLATAEDMAADIGIPLDLLCQYIHIVTGKQVLSWRKELRIFEAQRLMTDYPDLPFTSIGQMVGIEDKSNFRRQFAEVTGMMPREWRDRRRQ